MQKISGIQMLFLMTTFDTGMSLMAMISPTVQKAHQDAWISIGVATVASMGFTYLALRLSRMYPDKSFVECFKTVFSPVLGIPIIALYAIQWIVVTGMAARQIVDFAMPALKLYATPIVVVLICILLLAAYASGIGGIESLARCSEIITPLVIPTLILVMLMTFRIRDLSNLLPMTQPHLTQSIITGSIPATSFLTQSTLVMVIYPYLADKKSHMAGVWGTGVAGLVLMLGVLQTTATFGPNLPAKMLYPFFTLTRFVSIADFIQNADAVIVVIWFFSAFLRVATYSWVAAQVTTDLTRMNIRLSVAFTSVCAFIISLVPRSIVMSTVEYPSKVVEPIVLPLLNIGLPILGLMMGAILTRRRRHN